jgi:hypothetical protein
MACENLSLGQRSEEQVETLVSFLTNCIICQVLQSRRQEQGREMEDANLLQPQN